MWNQQTLLDQEYYWSHITIHFVIVLLLHVGAPSSKKASSSVVSNKTGMKFVRIVLQLEVNDAPVIDLTSLAELHFSAMTFLT